MDDLRGDKPVTGGGGGGGKIIAALVVASLVAAAGAYTYQIGMWNPKAPANQVVASKDMPTPSEPSPLNATPHVLPTQNEPPQPTQTQPSSPPTPDAQDSPASQPTTPQ